MILVEVLVLKTDQKILNTLEQVPDKSNLIDKAQTVEMISNTQEIAKRVEGIPLFICVDEEGGTVVRIANNPKFGVRKIELRFLTVME